MSPSELDTQIADAMRAHDADRLQALRDVKALATNIAKRDGSVPNDDTVARAAKAAARTTQEEIEQRKAARPEGDERTSHLEAQLETLMSMCPQEMSPEALEALVTEAIAACGATSMRDMRAVIAHVKEHATGDFDNGTVAQIVRKALAK